MYMQGFRDLLILFTVGCLVGCIEPYEFDADTSIDNILVINAQLTDQNEQTDILLSYASPYGAGPGDPVSGANILLTGTDIVATAYTEIKPGQYRLNSLVKGTAGEQYALRVELADGSVYESPPQAMPINIAADSLSWSAGSFESITSTGNVLINNVIDIYIHSPLERDGQRARLRWAVDEAYSFTEIFCGGLDVVSTCYMTGIPLNAAEIVTFDAKENTDARLERFLLSSKEVSTGSPEFSSKHYFNVLQYNLSPAAFEYWEKTAEVANPSGGIFDPPPAPIFSNLVNTANPDEVVLGFFEVAAVDTVRIGITRSELASSFTFTNFCPTQGFPNLPPTFRSECCNCLIFPNSSFNRPSYWE